MIIMARKKSTARKKRTISPEQQAKMQAARALKRELKGRIRAAERLAESTGADLSEHKDLSQKAIESARRSFAHIKHK